MRGAAVLMFVLFAATALPASALAVAPVNDTKAGATLLGKLGYGTPESVSIPPAPGAGGWLDATDTEDNQPGAPAAPACFGSAGFHSLWYQVSVPEASLLTATLSSPNPTRYTPLVTILDTAACGLGGKTLPADIGVSAAAYVGKGQYFIRIASAVDNASPDDVDLPTLSLTVSLRDVTPPEIQVSVSKIVGVHVPITFDATASTDGNGSGIDPTSVTWTFYDAGTKTMISGLTATTPEVVTHTWSTPGLHLVTLQLADRGANVSTYSFNVLVHSFVAPKVAMRVLVPKVGAGLLRVVLAHDQPVRVRLVVLQGGVVLRTISSKALTGSSASTLAIALQHRISKTGGDVVVTGTASDLSTNPNTVPLPLCSVLPGVRGSVVCA